MRHRPANPSSLGPKAGCFCHEDAKSISRQVLRRDRSQTVVIDLSYANDATTAGFATLVLLRRQLLQQGRDLRVVGLRERARYVYSISRLTDVLPSSPLRAA